MGSHRTSVDMHGAMKLLFYRAAFLVVNPASSGQQSRHRTSHKASRRPRSCLETSPNPIPTESVRLASHLGLPGLPAHHGS